MNTNVVLFIALVVCSVICFALYWHERKKDNEGKEQ